MVLGCPSRDFEDVKVREISARSALQPSGLSGLDYSLNPYRGCQHGCAYCYAPAVLREKREWGTFVDVRRNIPNVLDREVRRKEKGTVGISTVTDPYQPLERDLEVTRRCLEVLLRRDWPVSIQTKSSLVGRDLDLLGEFRKADVGMTITAMDDEVRCLYEPCTSPVQDQFGALSRLADAGVETWIFVAPLVPFITERYVEEMVAGAQEAGVGTVMIDGMRTRGASWDGLKKALEGHIEDVDRRMGELRKGDDGLGYFSELATRIQDLCTDRGVRCRVFVGNEDI